MLYSITEFITYLVLSFMWILCSEAIMLIVLTSELCIFLYCVEGEDVTLPSRCVALPLLYERG